MVLRTIVRAVAVLAAVSISVRADAEDSGAAVNVVPIPVRCEPDAKPFVLTAKTRILVDHDATAVQTASMLADRLRTASGFPLPVEQAAADTPRGGTIVLTTRDADAKLGAEGYELIVSAESLVIRAPAAAGLFYGTQTLRQLLGPQAESPTKADAASWTVPGVRIWDRPRFAYRGFMLDSSRHLQSEAFVRRTLDLMAYHKLNRFHWHLTDDPGWRIEIRKYPKLTAVGAWRMTDGQRYGGFFTQEQIRDLVAYAAKRHITIVPEIDMPAHSAAALAAYPHLACVPGEFKVLNPCHGIPDVYCPGKPSTVEFIEAVLTEVMELFPSPVIHIGGDECNKTRWKSCPHCQAVIQREGLSDEDALQSWFTGRIAAFLRSKGRRLMGWNEIMRGGQLPKDAIVHQWNDERAAVEATRAGNDVVVSRATWAYFDHGWDAASVKSLFDGLKARGIDATGWGYGITTLRKVYESDPVPADLPAEQARHILGAQAQLWTELRVDDVAADEYIWPRLIALAEVCWSPRERLDWSDFRRRMETAHFRRLAVRGLGAGASSPDVLQMQLRQRAGFTEAESAAK